MRICRLGLGKDGLAHLYEEIAQSGNEGMTLALFTELAAKVEFHMNPEKLKSLFRVMDKDHNGSLKFNEMYQVSNTIYMYIYIS